MSLLPVNDRGAKHALVGILQFFAIAATDLLGAVVAQHQQLAIAKYRCSFRVQVRARGVEDRLRCGSAAFPVVNA